MNFRFIYRDTTLCSRMQDNRDKTGCLCLSRRKFLPNLRSLCSSNTDCHHTRSAGGGNRGGCILVDFKAVHGWKLDVLLEMPRCGQGIDSARGQLGTVIYLSAKPDLLLLAIPDHSKRFTGLSWPKRDVFLLARQEVTPFEAWGAEELILW